MQYFRNDKVAAPLKHEKDDVMSALGITNFRNDKVAAPLKRGYGTCHIIMYKGMKCCMTGSTAAFRFSLTKHFLLNL